MKTFRLYLTSFGAINISRILWGSIVMKPCASKLANFIITVALPTFLWLSLPVTASASAMCNAFQGLATYKPELTIVYNTVLRQPSNSASALVDFEGGGEIHLTLTRYTKQFRADVTLRVLLYDDEANPIFVCEKKFGALGADFPSAGVVLDVQGDHKMRFEVYDAGNGGATGDPPYLVEMRIEGKSKQSKPVAAPVVIPSSSPGGCEVVNGPKRDQATLEQVRSERLTTLREGHVFVGYTFGGRNLYLRLHSPLPPGAFLTARFFSKPYGEQAFQEICRIDLSTLSAPHDIALATLTEERIFNPLWRVEVVVEPGGASYAKDVSFDIYRELDPERQSAVEGGEAPAAYLCVKPLGRGIVIKSASDGFASVPVLSIEIDHNASTLAPGAAERVRQMLLTAMAVWRRACTTCVLEHLLFVVIDGQLYSIGDAAAALVQTAPVMTGPPRLGDPVLPTLNSYQAGTRTPIEVYEPLPPNDPIIQRLCAMDASQLSPISLKVREYLECPRHSPPAALKLILTPLNKDTTCGSNPEIVACEPDRLHVELSGKNYTFRGTSGEPLFGTGKRSADMQTVLLHEIGHWIGLGHTAVGEGVMSGSLQYARCVDNEAIGSLARIASGQAKPADQKFALKYFANP
ncbi:matrixin family metalloprotease [Rhizobium leguminosarum]|uniref:matrixin family metalloprotease n=1 Tax=Rhizobium leguminosarum TaxID=384 RepID=UPI0032AFCFBE